jgi:hypothetical protein
MWAKMFVHVCLCAYVCVLCVSMYIYVCIGSVCVHFILHV